MPFACHTPLGRKNSLRGMTALALLAVATPALAEEVNLYSYRQPELLKPLTDGFTEATGIDVNVAYLSSGMIERLQAEGDRSPADLLFTACGRG